MAADNAFWQWVFVAGLLSVVCAVLLGMLLKAPAVSVGGGGVSARLPPQARQTRRTPSALSLGAMAGAERALFGEDAFNVSSPCDLFDGHDFCHGRDDTSLFNDRWTDPLFAHEIDNIWHDSSLDFSQTDAIFSRDFDDFGCSFGDDD